MCIEINEWKDIAATVCIRFDIHAKIYVTFYILRHTLHFWKCNFPMNHSVCLSVSLSVWVTFCRVWRLVPFFSVGFFREFHVKIINCKICFYSNPIEEPLSQLNHEEWRVKMIETFHFLKSIRWTIRFHNDCHPLHNVNSKLKPVVLLYNMQYPQNNLQFPYPSNEFPDTMC